MPYKDTSKEWLSKQMYLSQYHEKYDKIKYDMLRESVWKFEEIFWDIFIVYFVIMSFWQILRGIQVLQEDHLEYQKKKISKRRGGGTGWIQVLHLFFEGQDVLKVSVRLNVTNHSHWFGWVYLFVGIYLLCRHDARLVYV